jgi:hypothetical protein
MPLRVQPIPRPVLPRYHEGSALRPPSDADSVGKQWLKSDAIANQVILLTEAVKRLQDQINRLRIRKGSTDSDGPPCPYA